MRYINNKLRISICIFFFTFQSVLKRRKINIFPFSVRALKKQIKKIYTQLNWISTTSHVCCVYLSTYICSSSVWIFYFESFLGTFPYPSARKNRKNRARRENRMLSFPSGPDETRCFPVSHYLLSFFPTRFFFIYIRFTSEPEK